MLVKKNKCTLRFTSFYLSSSSSPHRFFFFISFSLLRSLFSTLTSSSPLSSILSTSAIFLPLSLHLFCFPTSRKWFTGGGHCNGGAGDPNDVVVSARSLSTSDKSSLSSHMLNHPFHFLSSAQGPAYVQISLNGKGSEIGKQLQIISDCI